MTTFMPVEKRCAICKAKATYMEVASTITFRSPDLDLRPSELQRSTMDSWIQECPKCGYVSYDIENKTKIKIDWLKNDKYLNCDGVKLQSELAKKFYKSYIINTECKQTENAFDDILHCAWACDDKNDKDNAVHCRNIAIELLSDLIDNTEDESEKDTLKLQKLDIMRRVGQYEKLLNEYSGISFETELLNQIFMFEMEKSKLKDDSCYTIDDAVKFFEE